MAEVRNQMAFEPCMCCGSYEINPATMLCDECAEDACIDNYHEEEEDE